MVKSSIKEEERVGLDLLAEYVGKYLKPNMLENILSRICWKIFKAEYVGKYLKDEDNVPPGQHMLHK